MPYNIDTGWQDLTLDEALENEKEKFQSAMAVPLDLSPQSPFGKLVRIMAAKDVEADAIAKDAVNASQIFYATGVTLDRLAANYNVQRKLATSSEATLTITGEVGYLIAANTIFETEDGTEFENYEDVQIDQSGNATVDVYSVDEASYTNVAANTITIQGEVVDEIYTITNDDPATGGTDIETDYDLRRRAIQSERSEENGTPNGLKTALLNVDGVDDVHIVFNPTLEPNANGDPMLSTHIYIMGGDSDDIADKLISVAGAELFTVGTQQATTVDNSGNTVTYNFDYEIKKEVTVQIKIATDDDYTDGSVQESVIEFFESLSMGDPIIVNKIYSYVYDNLGVDTVDSITVTKDGTAYTDKVPFAYNELATITETDVQITTE